MHKETLFWLYLCLPTGEESQLMSGHDAGFTHVRTFTAAHFIHRMTSHLAVSWALFMLEPCSLLEIHKHMLTLKRSRNYKAIKHAPFQEFAKRTERRGLLVCCISDHTWKKNLQKSEQEDGSGCCSQRLQFTNMWHCSTKRAASITCIVGQSWLGAANIFFNYNLVDLLADPQILSS